MATINAIVISTVEDLKSYRKAASDLLQEIARETTGSHWINDNSMEHQVQIGTAERPLAVSKRWVNESDWILLIVGFAYGTVAPEAESRGRSITECEYWQAVEAVPPKRVLVFLADEKHYDRSAEEEYDLRRAMDFSQSVESRESIRRFRAELCEAKVLNQFKDLAMFRDQLRAALRKAVKELPNLPAGTPLAKLVVKFTQPIRDFTRKIALIRRCKRTHDYLHDARQLVVAPAQVQLVDPWLKGGVLTREMERLANTFASLLERQRGKLESLLEEFATSEQEPLRKLVEKVLANSDFWKSETPIEDPQAYAAALDRLSGFLEKAFREADASMKREADSLLRIYTNLTDEINDSRGSSALSEAGNLEVSKNLKALRDISDRLGTAFERHNCWQLLHNELVKLDHLRETGEFEKEVRSFCDDHLTTLLVMIGECDSISKAAPEIAAQIAATSTLVPCKLPDLEKFKRSLSLLTDVVDYDRYVSARGPFDKAFLWIDKYTLAVVQEIGTRASDIEKRVDELNRRELHAGT